MKNEIQVPRMGESITEAHIGQIFKPTGSQVKQDDEILELETDKVNQILYAPCDGVVALSVKPEETVKIGQVIGSVEPSGATEKETPAPTPAPTPEPAPAPPAPPQPEGEARVKKEEFVKTLEEKKPEVKGKETRKKMSPIRQTIAKRLVEAKSETAMLTTFNEIDMSAVIGLREKYKEAFQKQYGVKLGFMSFFIKAACEALKHFPQLNSYIEGQEIVERHQIDMGIAVSADRGLVVPVLKNADSLSMPELEKNLEMYSKKAREGGLTVDDIRGGSFTITNGGTFGSLLSTPILNFPQSGILGMHAIQKRAVVIQDTVQIRPMMYVALTYDHRLVDGKEAVLFLVEIKNLLEDPNRFLLGV